MSDAPVIVTGPAPALKRGRVVVHRVVVKCGALVNVHEFHDERDAVALVDRLLSEGAQRPA